MLTVGIHVGYFTIRVSRSYINPQGEQIVTAVERTSHGIGDWLAQYQGSIPNVYSIATQRVGYDALAEQDTKTLARLDSHFFWQLFEATEAGQSAKGTWTNLLRTISRSLSVKDQSAVGIYLEGVETSEAKSVWTPWARAQDRSNDFVQVFTEHGKKLGFGTWLLVKDRDSVQRTVMAMQGVENGDVVVNVGGIATHLWRVEDISSGKLTPLRNTWGLSKIAPNPTDAAKEEREKRLLSALQKPGEEMGIETITDVSEWQDHVHNDLRRVKQKHPNTQFWIGGEGAALLRGVIAARMLSNPLFLHASSSARLANDYVNKEQ